MSHSFITTLTNNFTLSIPKHLRAKGNLHPGQKFQIIELANKIEFIQNKIKYYIPYTTEKGKTDDDYLYDALKEKYGL